MKATTSLSQFEQMNKKQQQFIHFKSIPYSEDLAVQVFSTIEQLPWSMLLKSSSKEHVNSRYDILVADPVAVIETHGEKSTISRDGQTLSSKEDPFELLRGLLDEIGVQPSSSELPFIGGALGYFAYDLGRRIETLPDNAINDINCADMAVGIYDWALIVDHKKQAATLVSKDLSQRVDWLNQCHATTLAPFSLTSDWQANLSKKQYQSRFDSVQNYLNSGDCYQINLAQRFSAQYKGSEWLAFQELDTKNSAPFSAFIRTPSSAILSVSPERFLLLEESSIETKPIKGTRPRGRNVIEDQASANELKQAPKDQAENLMIVDLLRNDIGRVAQPGSVKVPQLFEIESFPAVHHLVSTITAKLDRSYQATDLLRACFPGGSITGAPKIRAMQIIEELEPHRRNVYCGSIGYISLDGKMDTSITIRTLIAQNEHLYAWAGGGIVADSQCDSEYQETFDKLSKILPVLRNM
ncbi:aminodeoxychorismate synthase component 1 [Vibrio sp. ZSDZ34]|jgi:para-aminobenzoate synthetase component 1|uniref:aminodeoxychorismate synthase n=2 Tax=Vibrio gelatinilyticus TaxID=2893468 RepID=A0A9X2AX40_9VIBR|nr:aminodeoxychorismate synthase component 1 [Vibrio gelatinilyticus]MCJ2375238.1 aminodeoxychorismate synthase component 1 [Vibrio gelatinilyticus]